MEFHGVTIPNDGQWHSLKAELVNGIVRVWIDGVRVR